MLRLAPCGVGMMTTAGVSGVLSNKMAPVTATSAQRSIGCTYYEAGLKELLRLMVNSVGGVEHVRCNTRGEGNCSWRAEWRPTKAE